MNELAVLSSLVLLGFAARTAAPIKVTRGVWRREGTQSMVADESHCSDHGRPLMPFMKSIFGITAAAAVVATVAGCSSESYYGPAYGPYSSPPAYYRTSTYGYSYPQPSPRRAYDGYWDYQRNYRGIHSSPEFSSM